MRGRQPAKEANVSLAASKLILLVVTDAATARDHDHADWADASITYTGPRRV